ncbi:MAG TPA: FecR domain-containing protein [Puia sp.]|nr:FecR domain-containing protein [Puia sp.]
MMDEEIKALLVKYITGNADSTERQLVRRWLDESQDNVDYFTSLKAAWDDSLYHPGGRRVHAGEAFERLRKRLVPQEVPVAAPPIKEQVRRRSLLPRAAAVLFVLLAGGAGLYLYRKNVTPTTARLAFDMYVPNGKMKKIVLPDSSEVWLNAGTHLSYDAGFGEYTREVSLEGEGYFAVKHKENIPFIVHAHGYMVRDIGTIFTVSAYPNTNFQAAVIEGEVEVSGQRIYASKEGKVFLTRNQVLNIKEYTSQQEKPAGHAPNKPAAGHEQSLEPEVTAAPEMDRYAGWKDDLQIFEDETFDEVAQRLERAFDVKIRITSNQLARFRYTGRFNKVHDIREALRIIEETTPITYHTEKDTIIISMDKKGL